MLVICIEDINFFKEGNEYKVHGISATIGNPKFKDFKLESDNGHFYWRSSEYFMCKEEYRNKQITEILK